MHGRGIRKAVVGFLVTMAVLAGISGAVLATTSTAAPAGTSAIAALEYAL